MELIGRVIEIKVDSYIVSINNKIVNAILNGKQKRSRNILVGDLVLLKETYDKYVITGVKERKNYLIRPPVSNIDMLVIVISIDTPKPDYILLDKQIILCKEKNIIPVICINKIDLSKDNDELKKELEYINNTYKNIVFDIIYTSTITNEGIDNLKEILKGKISAFSGNSGVGKSSLTSIILNGKKEDINNKDEEIEVGEIGIKSKKGKHTTKYVKLYDIENNTYLLDTPGFSSYELYDIEYKKLKDYYPDFRDFICKYEDCRHINEDESVCAVKEAVKNNKLDRLRYDRYVYIFGKLKEIDDKKYK